MSGTQISVVIPSYNRAYLLTETLLSVRNQTFLNWECLVVDDASTDDTVQVVESFSKLDNRFKYLQNERKKGAQGSRNTGILHAKGDWICFLDSDDILTKNSLLNRLNSLAAVAAPESTGLLYGDMVNTAFKRVNGNAYTWMARNMALCPFSVMMVRKNLFTNSLLDERFPAWQDDDLVFELTHKCDFLHCGDIVAAFAPAARHDSITQSKKKLGDGLELMIRKRKSEILKTGGRIRLLTWYLRLATLKMEGLKSDHFYVRKSILRKPLSLIIYFMRMLWYKKI